MDFGIEETRQESPDFSKRNPLFKEFGW
jgi:hypothetical protein